MFVCVNSGLYLSKLRRQVSIVKIWYWIHHQGQIFILLALTTYHMALINISRMCMRHSLNLSLFHVFILCVTSQMVVHKGSCGGGKSLMCYG